MENIKIPIGVSIRVDDVGWFEGADDRHLGRPSRSGLPRRHDPRDIRTLNEIGRRLGTKILCNLVIGEWDKRNRLRGVPHFTWDAATPWNAATVVEKNRDFFDGAFAALEEGDNLAYGYHSLLHSYYDDDGGLVGLKFAYPFVERDERGHAVRRPITSEEFERALELFFQIREDWGFKKPVIAFENPCGCIGTPDLECNLDFARILYRYGIRAWLWGGWPELSCVREGITFTRSLALTHDWNAFDLDPDYHYDCMLKEGMCSDICGHLTNFIRFQPEKNMEYADKWVAYFRRVTSHFGLLMAADTLAASAQTLYANYAAVDRVDGGYRIDLSAVDALKTDILGDELFVSLRDRKAPAIAGGTLYAHEARPDHVIYKIKRDGSPIVTLTM